MKIDASIFKSRLAQRIFVSFILCSIIPIGVLAFVSYLQITRHLEKESQARLAQSSRTMGRSIHERLLSSGYDLTGVISLYRRERDLVEPDEYYSGYLKTRFKNLSLMRGEAHVHLIGEMNGLSEEIWSFGQSGKKEDKFLLIEEAHSGRLPRILIGKRFRIEEHGTGLAIGEIRPEFLWGIPFRNNLPPRAEFFVLNNRQEILFSSFPEHDFVPMDAIRSELVLNASGPLEWAVDDQAFFASFWSIFLKPSFLTEKWTVVVSENKRDIFFAMDLFRRTFPSVIVLSLGVVLILSVRQIRRNMGPLDRLKEGAHRMAQKDFSTPVVVHSGDEFEELAVAFNSMSKQIAKQIQILTAIGEIDKVTLSTFQIEKILETVVSRLPKIFQCQGGGIILTDSETFNRTKLYLLGGGSQTIWVEAARGPFFDEVVPFKDHPQGKKVHSGEPLPNFLKPFQDKGLSDFLIFPLNLNENFSGLLILGFSPEGKKEERDGVQFREMTDQISVALNNARMMEQIRFLSFYDPITGLPNRDFLRNRSGQILKDAQEKNKVVSLLILDLDFFNRINDTLGHAIGDKLLKAAGQRICQSVEIWKDEIGRIRRDISVQVFYMGGDEFSIVIGNIPVVEEAGRVAHAIITAFTEPFHIEDHEIFVSLTIGIALFPFDGLDLDANLKNADRAMFNAKGEGRSTYRFFTPSMNAAAAEWLTLERDLRKSLARKEMRVHYQPKFDLTSRAITGMEALLHWHRPDEETVSPSKFIPIAEETGFIVPLGEWVLRTACEETKAINELSKQELRVSVNLSSVQFRREDIGDRIERILKETGLPPRCLELEITESVIMHDIGAAVSLLNRLKTLGIKLSVDDFGTGYSSLAYLKRFPLDVIKIDQSFVHGITNDPSDQAITEGIIMMAHSLNLKVVAEGVEQDDELRFLKRKGCDEGQGYLFGKPVPSEEFTMFLERNKIRSPNLSQY